MTEREPQAEKGSNNIGVEVIAGSMFSGKTEELMRRLRRVKIAKQKLQVFKPRIDDRYSEDKVASHAGRSLDATPVDNIKQLESKIEQDTTVIGIDEAQFFESEIVPFVLKLANEGKRVIVAGLDADFRGEPFGPMPNLMAVADRLEKVHAICMTCGHEANFTQRLINGEPAPADEPTILVGASEMYEARCRAHHEVPGKPHQIK